MSESTTPTTVVIPAKPWYTSKTMWANIITAAVATIGLILDSADVLKLPANWVLYLTIAVAILNLWFRMITVQPVSNSSAETALLRRTSHDSATMRRVS